MIQLLAPFALLFSRSVWARVLVVGAILAPGKRTVSSALRAVGLGHTEQFQRYHRVLNHAVWSAREASRVLLGVLVKTFVPNGPLVIGIDETLERRWGKKIVAKGIYRDPVRSTQERFVKASGLRWVCLMLLVPVPCMGVAVLERPRSVRALRRPARQATQEDNRLGPADAPLGEALVAQARDRCRSRFRLR
jgi:hypothetical protein